MIFVSYNRNKSYTPNRNGNGERPYNGDGSDEFFKKFSKLVVSRFYRHIQSSSLCLKIFVFTL